MNKISVIITILFSVIIVTATAADVKWFDGSNFVSYNINGKTAPVVTVALQMFSGDMQMVTGQTAKVDKNGTIQIYELDKNKSAISKLRKQNIPVDSITESMDAFWLGIRDAKIVIIGNNGRGTAYGILELSRMAGVSPWVWWADVTPERRVCLSLPETYETLQRPSVEYRGIFINDEDWGLQPWAARNMDTDLKDIGPRTHERIFELMLRLRANTFWPGMHPCTKAFWYYKDNPEVAARYGIVLGSSHCEPMLRNNVFEWSKMYGKDNDAYNWRTNRSEVEQYWRERVEGSRNQDAIYTLGMRGIHDSGMQGYKGTEQQKEGLTEVIAFQRELLNKTFGDVTKVPQMFCPYKEVLNAYNAGLKVPDDVMLCWVDDNHGYMRQLPNAKEQKRSGGHGLYYHLSYWGRPADYLWLSSISPSLISMELSRAYSQGVRRMWIINVGDIKPAEMELEFAMDLAWDINSWTPQRAAEYCRYWAAITFGESLADQIAAIKNEYYRLAASGKPEHIHLVEYTLEEQNQRISDYQALAARVDALRPLIPSRLRDAWYQLVEYPVKGAWLMNVKTLRARQSMIYAEAGQRDEALACAEEARSAYAQIQKLTTFYNKEMADGKWDGMMNFAPRGLDHFKMPKVANEADITNSLLTPNSSLFRSACPLTQRVCTPDWKTLNSKLYTASSRPFTYLPGLGPDGGSIGIWPMDMRAYNDPTDAPYAEYSVPVKAGKNSLTLRFVPSFPVNADYDMRYAISIDGGQPKVESIRLETVGKGSKLPQPQAAWIESVLRGWNGRQHSYNATADGNVTVRIYFLDPGLLLSSIQTIR